MRAREELTVKRPRLNLSVIADIGMEILDMVIIFGLLGEPSTITFGGGGGWKATLEREEKGAEAAEGRGLIKNLSLGSRSRWSLANRQDWTAELGSSGKSVWEG